MTAKKRRIRIHRGLTFALAIALTVGIAVVIFQRSGFLSYQLTEYVNSHYFKDTPFRFSCGEVKSDLMSRASIADPVIRYQDDFQSVRVFSADEIRVEYSVVEALKLKVIVRFLGLENVRVSLWYDRDGKPIIPMPGRTSGVPKEAGSSHVEIEKFSVRGLDFLAKKDGETYSMKDVDLVGSVRYVEGKGRIEVSQGRVGRTRDGGEISSLRAEAEFEDGAAVVKTLVARFKKSLVMASGRYERGRLVDVQGVFNPLDLGEISSVAWIDEQQGEVAGSVLFNGTRDSLAVEGSLTGRAAGLVFSGLALEGIVTPLRVDLAKVDGQVHGCRVDGKLGYERETGSFTFDGVCSGLDLTEGFLPDGGAPETDVNGSIRLDYDAGRKTYDVRARLHNSSVAGFEGEEMRFAGEWGEKTGLKVRAFDLARRGFSLSAFGSIDRKDRAEFVLSVEGSELDYAADYLALPRIGGAAKITGRLAGPMDDLQLNANGTWIGLEYLGARVDSSQVRVDARGVRGARASATIDVNGRRLDLFGREFTAPHILFEVDEKRVEVRDLSFARGDTLVTMDFEVETGGVRTPIKLNHVAVETPGGTWRNPDPATLSVSEDTTVVESFRLVSNGSQIAVSGRVSRSANTADLSFKGENIALSTLPTPAGSGFRLGGSADFDAAIRGNLENPDVRLSANVRDGFISDFAFTHLALDGEFSADGYRLHRLGLTQGADSLVASGWWKHAQSPVSVAREGLEKEAAWAAGIFVEAVGGGLPIDRLVERFRGGPPWSAAFSGRATLSQSLLDPHVDLAGVIRSEEGSALELPDIQTDLVYEKGRLAVRSLSVEDGGNRLAVRGFVPLGFEIERGFEFNPDADVDFDAEIDAGNLSIVPAYIDAVAAAAGRLTGRLEVRGPANDPSYRGGFKLRDAAFRLAGSDEIFRDVAADIELEGDQVKFTSVTARKEKKGSVVAAGTVTLEGFSISAYAFDAKLTDFFFSTIPGFESVQSGQVSVKSMVGEDGRSFPFVTGSLEVKHAVLTRSLAVQEGPPSPLTIPTDTPSWMCTIDLRAPKNVWVRNPEISMETGGDLILKRDRTGFYLRGDLRVLRGSYTLYNNKFRITEGRFDFATATTLRPGIYLDAYTPYRRSGDVEQKIFLSLSWPADEEEPKITLSYSEPGYSEADIWAMLGGQVVTGAAIGDEGSWNAGETATSLATNYLERILNAQMSDMTVAVESSPARQAGMTGSDESAVTIAVGRYLSDDLYLNYRQGLRVTSARQIDVEYRLSNMLLLRSEIIQHSQKGLQGKSRQATDEINFDLKFRWEY